MHQAHPKKKLLLVAPFSPPITGQSVATGLVHDALKDDATVTIYNTSKDSFRPGISSFFRIFSSIFLIIKLFFFKNRFDCIYYTVSQSKFGALKDVIVFLLLWRQLSKVILHSHGFGLKFEVLDKSFISRFLYRKVAKRLRSFVVLGKSHKKLLKTEFPDAKLRIVKNCAAKELFLYDEDIQIKFADIGTCINIIFLSNLLPGKGYMELLEAYADLPNEQASQIKITFAGGFGSDHDKREFLDKLRLVPNTSYVGVVELEDKIKLLRDAHIFCLPTYYRFEGQPISILEAYASGCAVLTTDHAGIKDISSDKNGFIVDKASINALKTSLQKLILERHNLCNIGKLNARVANSEYSEKIFKTEIYKLFL